MQGLGRMSVMKVARLRICSKMCSVSFMLPINFNGARMPTFEAFLVHFILMVRKLTKFLPILRSGGRIRLNSLIGLAGVGRVSFLGIRFYEILSSLIVQRRYVKTHPSN